MNEQAPNPPSTPDEAAPPTYPTYVPPVDDRSPAAGEEDAGPAPSGLRPGQGAPLVPGAPQSVGPPIAAGVFNVGALAYAGFGVLALIVLLILLLVVLHH